MNKISRKIFTTCMAFILIVTNSISVFASETNRTVQANCIELSKKNVENGVGVTFVLYIGKKGNIIQYHYNEKTSDFLKNANAKNFVATNKLSAKKYNDGKQELVIVHLSARNWTEKTLSLEFYGHSDEILQNIKGTWYCKSTSGKAYFSKYMTIPFYNSLNTVTTTLKSNINVGNAKTVRLGFSNVTFKNIFGYAGSLPPSWSNVSK